MKAIIVAGGRGERLRPLTDIIPKPMVPLVDKPLLLHTIELLKRHGVTDIILALCYMPEKITGYFKDGKKFGVNISYIFENPDKPLGTAGAIGSAKDLIADSFIVTYADILRDLDVTEMIKHHRRSKSFSTLNIYPHHGGNFKSLIQFDAKNRLTRFQEFKEAKALAEGFAWSNGSFYILEPEIFDYIQSGKKTDFATEVFPNLLADKKDIFVFPSSGHFIDIGTKESLKKAEDFAARRAVSGE